VTSTSCFWSRSIRAALALLAALAFGCEQPTARALPGASPSAAPARQDVKLAQPTLFSRRALLDGISELEDAVGAPPRALELTIHRDYLVLQAQNPKEPTEVLQYVYQDGKISKPVAVELRGEGELKDNLFPLENVKLDRVPDLCEQARQKVDADAGRVSHVLVRRDLPESMNVQFRIYVTSPAKDGYLDADQNGKAIESAVRD